MSIYIHVLWYIRVFKYAYSSQIRKKKITHSSYLSIQSSVSCWSTITIRSGGPNVIRNVYKCTRSVIYQGNDILITAPVNKAKQTRLRAFTLNRLPHAKRETSPCSSVRFQFSCLLFKKKYIYVKP